MPPTNQLPLTDPTSSRFGWPLVHRQLEFEKLKPGSRATHRMLLQGKLQDLPIIRVPLNLPKYRLENGRTASLQQEYLAIHQEKGADYFQRDPELLEVQETQHELLRRLVKQAGLLEHFKTPAHKQEEPIVLDEFGYVVNGNRRLAAWRDLHHEEAAMYSHFEYIDVVVLPHCDAREIDRIEARLQVHPDIRADYSWDTKANMLLQKQQQHGFTIKELGDLYGEKESEIKLLFTMRDYAVEYLRSRGKENHWSLVTESEYAFKKLAQGAEKIASFGEQQLFRDVAYILIDRPDAAGKRLYEAIPDAREHLGEIKRSLQDHFQVDPPANDDSLGDLFGGILTSPSSAAIDIPLSNVISEPQNTDSAREIILNVIESQNELKKDAETAQYLLTMLAKANTQVQAAINNGLRPESTRHGVEAQLCALEEKIGHVRRWLSRHA